MREAQRYFIADLRGDYGHRTAKGKTAPVQVHVGRVILSREKSAENGGTCVGKNEPIAERIDKHHV